MSQCNPKKKKKKTPYGSIRLVNYQSFIVTKILKIKFILYKLMLYSNYIISYTY